MAHQGARGSGIAQASGGSTAKVVNYTTIFQSAEPAPISESVLAEAIAKIETLPVDWVPEPAGLPAGSRMPHARNRQFVGRANDLKGIARALKGGGTAAVGETTALTGMGGIGKTQLAAEFAFRYGRWFEGGVFWLSFANPEAIAAEVATCGGPRELNLHEAFESLPLEGQVGLVATTWHSKLPRLLVFDNCEAEELLEAWLPRSGGCRVLVTSRKGVWSGHLGISPVPLGVLARPESIALILKHRPDLGANDPELDAIADALGDLPLALHMAGSYLATARHTEFGKPAKYLEAIRRPDLLAHRSLTEAGTTRNPTGHEQHVARTFALSLERLDREDASDALALQVLARAAWFAPGEPIPRDLLGLSAGVEASDEDAAFAFEAALARLVDLGLVEPDQGGAITLHRLIAAFVRAESEDPAAAREAVEEAVLKEARTLNKAGFPAPLLAWQPHLRAVADQAVEAGSAHAGGLSNELGYHLRMIADFAGAGAAYERALEIDEKAYGPDHPEVAIRVNNLGSVLRAEGDLAGARAAFERALVIDEKALGPDHPNVAIRVNNLGRVLHDQGDLAGARAAYERALEIGEYTLGPEHPSVATHVNNLGRVLHDQGDLAGARQAFERALEIDEKAYGPDHPEVATDVNNLGRVLQDQGDLAGARQAFEQALRIDEKALGPDHPKVAIRLWNLGDVFRKGGDFDAARQAFERALSSFERALGSDHPHTRGVRGHLEFLNREGKT